MVNLTHLSKVAVTIWFQFLAEISEEERGHRHEVTVKLTRQLSQRPTAQELRERGILRSEILRFGVNHCNNNVLIARTSREVAEDMEEKKRTLNRKVFYNLYTESVYLHSSEVLCMCNCVCVT